MAFTRTPRHLRSLLAGVALAALVGAGAVVVPHVAGATPGQPTISEVTAKLDKLAKQNEVLAEQYNAANAAVQAQQKAADAAQHKALAAATDFNKARARLRQTVTAAYESATLSPAGALLTSRNGQSYIDALTTMNLISAHRAELVSRIAAVHAKSQAAQQQATELLGAAQAKATALDKQKNKIEADTKKFKGMLAKLTAAQQAAYKQRNTVPPATARAAIKQTPAPAPTAPAGTPKANTAAAQRAVDYAIAQVGKGYVFAGTGPERVRLLRADDDGLGPRWGKPAAPVRGSVQRRHACQFQRPAAR